MEETLGKRISACRKKLGLTQDALAEKLGVTAQAVSKWENDQSCPDIAMLPKLSEVFGVTTDEILGLKQEKVHTAEVVTEENDGQEPEGIHLSGNDFEFHWDSGRKGSLGLALWVLLTGGLLLLCPYWTPEKITLWEVLWPSGLLVFGLMGLWPKFSVLRLGCGFFGGYFLLCNLRVIHPQLAKAYLLPVFLLLFGLSLLLDALKRPGKGSFSVTRNGVNMRKNHCTTEGDGFQCEGSFGSIRHLIQLPRLASGTADLSFGEMVVDLSGCEEISENCHLELNCSFGELELLVPRRWRVVPDPATAFATIETKGAPSPEPEGLIRVECSANFGQITLRYI